MFDKQMEKKLQNALGHIDPKKLEQIKGMINGGDLGKLAEQLDTQKVRQKLNELHLNDALEGVNLSGLVGELKKNPEIINELRKNL